MASAVIPALHSVVKGIMGPCRRHGSYPPIVRAHRKNCSDRKAAESGTRLNTFGKRHNEQAMLLVHMAVLLFLYSIPGPCGNASFGCFARKRNAYEPRPDDPFLPPPKTSWFHSENSTAACSKIYITPCRTALRVFPRQGHQKAPRHHGTMTPLAAAASYGNGAPPQAQWKPKLPPISFEALTRRPSQGLSASSLCSFGEP